MSSEYLSPSQLEGLRALSSPKVADAIEQFYPGPAREGGYTAAGLSAICPEAGTVVGYACTSTVRSHQPPAEALVGGAFDVNAFREYSIRIMYEWWDRSLESPAPRIAVIQELDPPPSVGGAWGEVMTHVHRALGFVGAIVDGGVRDVDEIRAAGFPVFARDIVVSHAYVHHVEPGATVEVDGLVVRPGDLIHADKHGAVVIPREIAADIADASNRIELAESKMIELTQSSTCTLDDIKSALIELREEFVA